MTTNLSRRLWLQRSAMAAAVLPISKWYIPEPEVQRSNSRGAEGPVKLNSNENAYGPGDAARKAIIDSLDKANRYAWPAIDALREEIAKREGLTPEHVLVTAGSTELLGLTGLVYGLHQGDLVACHPTFDFLLTYAEKLGAKWARTPVDENFQQDLNALDKATSANTKLIFICNPNNPTGIELPNDLLRSFCETQAKKYPVYIDEAYIELSPNGRQSSMVDLVDQNPNVIVGRTFSKVHGLAGMRIGYALAHPDTIAKLADLHIGRSMSISVAACAAAIASLHDAAFEAMSREKIIEGRNMVTSAFDQWGVKYLPSATNFVFFQNDKFKQEPVMAMEKENILLRNYKSFPGWTRVSIGKVEEMHLFLDTLQWYLA